MNLVTPASTIAVATIGYVFSKWRERGADWRKKKLEMYHEFFISLSGTVKEDSTSQSQKRFAESCNTIGLVASPEVIKALQIFLATTKPEAFSQQESALTNLFIEIRKDLGAPLKWILNLNTDCDPAALLHKVMGISKNFAPPAA